MAERSWRGTWWEPAQPDTERQGTLHYAEDGRLRLELVDGFDVTIRTPLPEGRGYSISRESRDLPLIHGIADGELFTLLDCYAYHTSGKGFWGREISRQDLRPQRALRGIHLNYPEEVVFKAGYLELERLLDWSDQETFYHPPVEDGQPGRRDWGTAGRLTSSRTIAHHDGIKIGLRINVTDFYTEHRPIANRRTIKSTASAILEFTTFGSVAHDAFYTIGKDLQDLLTLCSYAPCAVLGWTLTYETSETHPGPRGRTGEVEVLGRQVYPPTPLGQEKPLHDYLFTLADIDFSELIPRWLELKGKARTGFNILFGLRYIGAGYVGNRLLGAASAAENLHQGVLGGSKTPLSREQYKKLKVKLLAAIADEEEHVQAFVKEGLRNNRSYMERLHDLASIPDAEVVHRLLTDRTVWAKELKSARNGLAHATETPQDHDDAIPAFRLLEISYALLCLVTMAELGLSPEVQARVLDHPRISEAAYQFKKVVTDVAGDAGTSNADAQD